MDAASVIAGKRVDTLRLLIVASHPIQYLAPMLRRLAERPGLEFLVAYGSLQGARRGIDPEFEVEVAWDVPMLEGYRWISLRNYSPRPGLRHFFGLINPGVVPLLRSKAFHAVLVYGYAFFTFALSLVAAKIWGVPLILATDAVALRSGRGGWWWKRWVKAAFARRIYRAADVVLVPSTATARFIRSLGVDETRIAFAHYTVDNESFVHAASKVDRVDARRRLGVPDHAFVVLFCAKLVPRKRPHEALRGVARLMRDGDGGRTSRPAYLVFAGDGPLRAGLEGETAALGVADRVRFLGFVNQSRLPEIYVAADVLLLPSEHEPWGLVVNEAILCGCVAIVSDAVGAHHDLIRDGETGFVYPCGDVDTLTTILGRLAADGRKLEAVRERGRRRMETWSYREAIDGYVEAVQRAVASEPA